MLKKMYAHVMAQLGLRLCQMEAHPLRSAEVRGSQHMQNLPFHSSSPRR